MRNAQQRSISTKFSFLLLVVCFVVLLLLAVATTRASARQWGGEKKKYKKKQNSSSSKGGGGGEQKKGEASAGSAGSGDDPTECDATADGSCPNADDGGGGDSKAAGESSLSRRSIDKKATEDPPPPVVECGLYLAPSTVPNAGLGVFSGFDKQVGDSIGNNDLCIPFLDMYWHNEVHFFPNVFRDYFWMGTSMGMGAETDSDDIEAFCPGLDCLVNCNPALLNVAKSTPLYDEAGLHRSRDPGAGSRTPYHNGTTYVSKVIPRGSELFKDYGDSWFDHRYKIFGEMPFERHYQRAQKLLNKVMDLKLKDDDKTMEDLYNVMKVLKVSHKTPGSSFAGRVLNALPDSYEDAKWAHKHSLQDLHQPAATHSLEYLRENGRCMDHIRSGKSKIEQAGRGAFATRDLPAGTVITTTPLHHVHDEAFVNMYNFTSLDETGEYVRITDQVVGKQLILNYCFGHPASTLLVCPYGSGISYINHNREEANVKVRWAENFPLGHNASVVEDGPFSIFRETEKAMLSFDYVATKDISANDELFLDYGDEWIAAWEKHVADWKPYGERPEQYASGRYMNEHFGNSILRTQEEQEYDPYPDHLQIRCHSGLVNADGKTRFVFNLRDYGLPCHILHREERQHGHYYTVELEYIKEPEEEGEEDTHTIYRIIRANVPRRSLAFFDMPGTTDINLPNAFRHKIGIPDEIFPEHWKNKPFESKGRRTMKLSKT